jgi:3-oxoacyl-[acyl-carrier-protein] synthase-3
VTHAPPGILGLGAYVPERVMENEEWSQYVDTSDEWIRERTGIERRRIAADDQSTVDLALEAALRAMADAGIEVTELDEIILATDTPECPCPDSAAILQHRLGAREIPTFDLTGSGCAGFLQGVDLARSRVLTGKSRVLVVGVEVISRLMSWEDRNTCVLFGDAAGAVVVGHGGAEILSVTTGTDGSCARILGREIGGTRAPYTLERVKAGRHLEIVMDGREVYRHAVARMQQAAEEALRLAECELADVDLYVPHQANRRIVDTLRAHLHLPEERVYVNLQEYGNTGSASVPLALAEARERGLVPPGALVLMTAFGAGFHWAGAVVRF